MNTLTDKQTRELRQLARLPDGEIDTSDAPERPDFAGGVRGRFHRPSPQPVTLRIDADILDWLAARGEPVQTPINAALRDYLTHHHGR